MNDSDVKELASKCKAIKITRSIEDIFSEIGFNTTIDQQAKMWLEQLKATWKTWKKNAVVENHVIGFFQAWPDPFRIALIFAVHCEEFKDCKPKTLPYFIMETLLRFSSMEKVYADDYLKRPAFHAAVNQRNQHFFSLVVRTYQLASIKEYVVPIVKDMMKNDNCRQASQVVMAMDMFEDIPVQHLLFPLILHDKSNMIDEYLTQCPSQVKPLLAFLDDLLDKNFKTLDFVQKYAEEHNICEVRYDKMHHKPLGKLVARLCNKFNIPIETCPNLSMNRTTGGLKYLIYQKYVAHNVSSMVWDDLVKDSLRQHPDSAPTFIDMLVDHDPNEAIKWARHLNMPENQVPLAIQGFSKTQKTENEPKEEDWDTNAGPQDQLYYKSPLTRDQIIIVDSGDFFFNMINSGLKNQEVVSMDCEWKPSFGAKQSQVAIIQIGTNNKVYLVDSIVLNKQQYVNLWHSFYKSFLDNAEIIKLGFGLEQDLREMKASIAGLGNIKVKGEGFLDLSILWKSLLSRKLSLPGASDSGASLSSVVQACFGKPLEKSEQCSNWELRPLRESQIKYAALDAHILLQIYYFLQRKCHEQGIKFEELCNDVMVETKKKSTKKPKVVDRLNFNVSFSQVFEVKLASEIKFLVEPMLSCLMSYLRYCGIDTSIVRSAKMLWHDIINLAISEDRFILIVKPKISPTVKFSQSSILSVGKVTVQEQLRNILETYRIVIEQADIMSICLYCNSKDLRKLCSDEIQQICTQYVMAGSSSKTHTFVDQDEEDVEDYYKRFISDSDDDELPNPPVPSNYQPATNKTCKTAKGASIDISNLQQLRLSGKSAILCESCGKMFSKNDDLIKSVSETVLPMINLTHQME